MDCERMNERKQEKHIQSASTVWASRDVALLNAQSCAPKLPDDYSLSLSFPRTSFTTRFLLSLSLSLSLSLPLFLFIFVSVSLSSILVSFTVVRPTIPEIEFRNRPNIFVVSHLRHRSSQPRQQQVKRQQKSYESSRHRRIRMGVKRIEVKISWGVLK